MRQGKLLFLLSLVMLFTAGTAVADSGEWQPILPEDLSMTQESKAPAAPAIYLYRQVDRDDNNSWEDVYARIKILNEEGLKYANLEIPFVKGSESIRSLEARSISPDGAVTAFNGEVYEKPLVKSRDVKLMAKTIALPNVTVGSIIEYRYRRRTPSGWIFNSQWLLSEDLFTRHAKFSLRPYSAFAMRWSWPLGLPDGTDAPKKQGDLIRLETRNVAAFVSEDYMPPEEVMKFRVDFIYDTVNATGDVDKYWKDFGTSAHRRVESFVKGKAVLQREVDKIVQVEDSPETKLRKIYVRTQQIRNTTFEPDQTEQEEKRARLQDAKSAADVLEHGYGDRVEITWLFLGLVRTAGLPADAVLLGRRDRNFFDKRLMNSRQLNGYAVVVTLGDREVYLDPGAMYTPFGVLPWYETAVTGLRLDKSGGKWLSTPKAAIADSRVARRATFRLNEQGSLEGKVTVTYTGLEAAWRRVTERHDDEEDRRKFLKDELERDVPVGLDVKVTNSPDWTNGDKPLVVEYDVKIPGWATTLGKRVLLPVGVFSGGEKHMFEHAARVHPVYFQFPSRHTDDISVEFPKGWKVGSLPKGRAVDRGVAAYSMTMDLSSDGLRMKRDLSHEILVVPATGYAQLRDFFQTVRAGDEEQVVLSPGS